MTTHYENFPVASLLCPRHLRQPVLSIYSFARTADDIADEGHHPPQKRLDALAQYRDDLQAITQRRSHSGRFGNVFDNLTETIERFSLPVHEFEKLLSAFEQDVHYSSQMRWYYNDASLLDYCSRSANPIGRLILRLNDINDPETIKQSDSICTALQLINFWQDLAIDIPRMRFYLSLETCKRHAVSVDDIKTLRMSDKIRNMIQTQVEKAKLIMHQGAPLVHRLPGRMGWELRFVVQGGLRIAEKLKAIDFASLHTRPTINKKDLPTMAWRAFWM